MMKRVIENENFARDEKSRAIINTNATALQAHRQRKMQLYKMAELEQSVSRLNDDITDIKKMLNQLLNSR